MLGFKTRISKNLIYIFLFLSKGFYGIYENSYEMPGLDIVDFVGTILNWSDYVEVLYYDEYIEQNDS